MLDTKSLLGSLLQSGLSRSSGSRVDHALGPQGLGGAGGLLGQILGGGGGGSSGVGGMLGRAGQEVKGGNPLAIGGLGALAGAVLGQGKNPLGNAIGGGALALLGTLAWQALKKSQAPDAPTPVPSSPAELPLGARAPETPAEEAVLADHATVLLQAMISAAKADGQIDGSEMERILGRLDEAGAGTEERDFVLRELRKPLDLPALVANITTPELAAEAYGASLLAIEVDTGAERDYLRRLAQSLRLDPIVVRQLHAALGAPQLT
jgi:uncharacterized membrane protein YebE (DUF533 family)